jgi:hypothetical protein
MKREALAVSKKIAVATIVNAANNFIDLILPGGVSRFRQSQEIGIKAGTIVVEKVRRERRWTSAGATPARELVRSTR